MLVGFANGLGGKLIFGVDDDDTLVGIETHYYYAGNGMHIAFIRVGNQSVKAQARDLKRLVLKAEQRSLDSEHLIMTIPDKPNSRGQKYMASKIGMKR